MPQRYHEVPRKYRWSCLQMTLRSPLVGAWAGRYPPNRRSHKRLLSHRWTVQAYPGDGGDDANALRAARVLMSTMATLASPQKITFAAMRESDARGLLVYCADHRCSHSIAVSADRWPDEVQLSDIEPRVTCISRGNLRRTGCTVPPFTSIAEH